MPAPSNSRQLALQALIEWEHGEAFAQELVDRLATQNRLAHRDAALTLTLVLGVLRNASLLDHWLDQVCDNKRLEDRILWTLRMGAAQLLILDMPPHAVVNETVNLAGGGARGLVNAVLRRIDRERDTLLGQAATLPLADRYSHPEWLVERWTEQRGAEVAQQWCEWNQQPAPIFIRANALHSRPLEPAETEGFKPARVNGFFQVDSPPRDWLEQGRCYAQDPSTVMACDLLAPVAGETVLDACAAPGGKTAYLAQLMGNEGKITACDLSPRRLDRLSGNLRRLEVKNTQVATFDMTSDRTPPWGAGRFDRILLDVPCSNTGVMRRRVDVRWRLEPWNIEELTAQQARILTKALAMLKPGGTLVYSTCSLDREENQGVLDSVLAQHTNVKLEATKEVTPWKDGFDGAFAAKLVRAAE